MTWQAAWAPIWGPEAGHYFYLVALLTVGGGLRLTARVAGPCPRAESVTLGIIASIQAWHDTARRASSLPYKPQSQIWSQKETSFSLQGGSLSHLCGFLFVSQVQEQNPKPHPASSCVCTHVQERQREGDWKHSQNSLFPCHQAFITESNLQQCQLSLDEFLASL